MGSGGFGHRFTPPLLAGVPVVADLDDVVAFGCVIEVLEGPLEPLVGCEPVDYLLRVHGLSGLRSICSSVARLGARARTGVRGLVFSASEHPV